MNGTLPASSISCCPERQSASRGGDVQGANLRTAYDTNNLLNQLTGRTVPGYVELLGTAHSNATVTLWAGSDWWASTVSHGTESTRDSAVLRMKNKLMNWEI